MEDEPCRVICSLWGRGTRRKSEGKTGKKYRQLVDRRGEMPPVSGNYPSGNYPQDSLTKSTNATRCYQ